MDPDFIGNYLYDPQANLHLVESIFAMKVEEAPADNQVSHIKGTLDSIVGDSHFEGFFTCENIDFIATPTSGRPHHYMGALRTIGMYTGTWFEVTDSPHVQTGLFVLYTKQSPEYPHLLELHNRNIELRKEKPDIA